MSVWNLIGTGRPPRVLFCDRYFSQNETRRSLRIRKTLHDLHNATWLNLRLCSVTLHVANWYMTRYATRAAKRYTSHYGTWPITLHRVLFCDGVAQRYMYHYGNVSHIASVCIGLRNRKVGCVSNWHAFSYWYVSHIDTVYRYEIESHSATRFFILGQSHNATASNLSICDYEYTTRPPYLLQN